MPTLQLATPDFLDTAPFRVVVSTTVAAPIGQVWSLIADQDSWPQWFDAMTSVQAAPRFWTEPGNTRSVTVNRLKVDEVAISVQPEREYAFSIVKWPLPVASMAAEGLRLEDRSDSDTPKTEITYIGAFALTRAGKLAAPLLKKQLTAAWGPAMARLGELGSQAGTDS